MTFEEAVFGLERYQVARYLKVARIVREQDTYKQDRRGRPGPDTVYRKITRRRYDIQWTLDDATVDYDKKSDGMYPSCRPRHDGYYAACRIMPRQPTSRPRNREALCSGASYESA